MNRTKISSKKVNLYLFFVIIFLITASSVFSQPEDEAQLPQLINSAIEEKKTEKIPPDAGGGKIWDSIKKNGKITEENPVGLERKLPDFDRKALDKVKTEQPLFPLPKIEGLRKSAINEDFPVDDSAKKDTKAEKEGFDWKSAFKQSFLFLSVQHGFAFTQAKTRRQLTGNFFKDYIRSVRKLRGWNDHGKFFTNYIAHPMQGSLTGFIMIQNDSKAKKLEFGNSKDYWASRLKSLAWSAAWSTQFEIGPLSQASIGNIGFQGKQAWVDIVITPTVGWTLLVAEDYADKHWIKRIEKKGFAAKVASRIIFNPTRAIANVLRFKVPWYRDNR